MPFKLKIIDTSQKSKADEKVFSRNIVRIGRHEENDVPLKENFVSGQHAEIITKGDTYYLEDQGSKNGTFLNNTRLKMKTPIELKDNDIIDIGGYCITFYSIDSINIDEDSGVGERTAMITLIDTKSEAKRLSLILRGAYCDNCEKDEDERRDAIRQIISTYFERSDIKEYRDEIVFEVKKRFMATDEKEDTGSFNIKKKEQASYEALSDITSIFFGKTKPLVNENEVIRFSNRLTETLKLLIENLSDRLKVYKEFQTQFDIDVTKILLLEPNPIKGAATPENIGRYLLDWENEDYKGASDDLKAVHLDLIIHQIAILKGFKKCFRELLMEVSPSSIEKDVDTGGFKKLLGYKNMWTKFVEKHKELTENETKTFNVILHKFQQAYLSFLQKNRDKNQKFSEITIE